MIEWYKKVVFQNYANFKGRARRSEYWYFALGSTVISIVLAVLDNATGLTFGEAKTGITGSLYSLLVLLPSIAVGIRRMHDVGKSGWFLLIPIYNLILACRAGDVGTNEYGADPKNSFDEINEIGTKEV